MNPAEHAAPSLEMIEQLPDFLQRFIRSYERPADFVSPSEASHHAAVQRIVQLRQDLMHVRDKLGTPQETDTTIDEVQRIAHEIKNQLIVAALSRPPFRVAS